MPTQIPAAKATDSGLEKLLIADMAPGSLTTKTIKQRRKMACDDLSVRDTALYALGHFENRAANRSATLAAVGLFAASNPMSVPAFDLPPQAGPGTLVDDLIGALSANANSLNRSAEAMLRELHDWPLSQLLVVLDRSRARKSRGEYPGGIAWSDERESCVAANLAL